MGVPLRTLYGQTELLGAYTLHPEGKVDPDTTGVPMADSVEIRIDNADVHGVGEIVVRHPNMFVRPEQVAEIGKRHSALGRLRLVVTREGETDAMPAPALECLSNE